jgi:hypothetical protein
VGWVEHAHPTDRRAVPIGSVDESADTEHVNGRDLDAATIAIVSDRARQARLCDADQAGRHDHRGRDNRSPRHGVVPQPHFDLGEM